MSDPESKAAVVIQNLLHQDLALRRKGLAALKSHWMIEYREYLWMAIEEEKSKSFQAELVAFALRTLEDRSLRKMIRFVEKDQLSTSATNRLLEVYLEYETDIVRKALIKSLQRVPSYTYKFVLKLLNQDQVYRDSDLSSHIIHDMLKPNIPDRYRQEFLVRIINHYFRSHQTFLKKIKIWDIIRQDPQLEFTMLRVFYNRKETLDLEIAKPQVKINLHLLAIVNDRINYPNRDESIVEWVDFPRELQFLYETRHSDNGRIIQEFLRINQQIDIPLLAYDTTMDGNLDAIYKAWNPVVLSMQDDLFLEIEEISEEYFSLLSLDDSIESSNYFSWIQELHINPHALIARVLTFLPRFFFLQQGKNPVSQSSHKLALRGLLDHKYWMTPKEHAKVSSSELLIQYMGPSQVWISVFDHICQVITADHSQELQNIALQLSYYLLDLLDSKPDFSSFFKSIHSRISTVDAITDDLDMSVSDSGKTLNNLSREIKFQLDRLKEVNKNTDLSVYQSNLEEFVFILEKGISSIQQLVDQVLAGLDRVNSQDRELLKIIKQLQTLGGVNYWYDLIVHYVCEQIKEVTRSLASYASEFESYYKRLGSVSEDLRDFIKTIGDPKEVDFSQSLLTSLQEIHRGFKNQIYSLQHRTSPFKRLEKFGTQSITSDLKQLEIDLVHTINIDTQGAILDPVVNSLKDLLNTYPDLSQKDKAQILASRLNPAISCNLDKLDPALQKLYLSYLLRLPFDPPIVSQVGHILETATMEVQQDSLDLFEQLQRFGLLVEGSSGSKSVLDLFLQSRYVKIRTSANLLRSRT